MIEEMWLFIVLFCDTDIIVMVLIVFFSALTFNSTSKTTILYNYIKDICKCRRSLYSYVLVVRTCCFDVWKSLVNTGLVSMYALSRNTFDKLNKFMLIYHAYLFFILI